MADPTFTSVVPAYGSPLGGTAITLTGTNFAAGAVVRIGGTAATSVVVVGPTSITCVTPAHASGLEDVQIINLDAGSVTAADAFTYEPLSSDEVKLEIWNLALAAIGERPVASLIETSKAANYCRQLYDRLLRVLLSGFDWKFAKKTAALTLTDPAPTSYRYALAYDLPTDCLRARRVITSGMQWEDSARIGFDVEGRTLLTDAEDAVLQYTRFETDASLFDPLFIDVFAKQLAVHLAMPITGKPEVLGNVFKMLQLTAPHAEATTANEQAKPEPRGDLKDSRL